VDGRVVQEERPPGFVEEMDERDAARLEKKGLGYDVDAHEVRERLAREAEEAEAKRIEDQRARSEADQEDKKLFRQEMQDLRRENEELAKRLAAVEKDGASGQQQVQKKQDRR
ncbi:MAG: hypothetical protein AAGM22_22725, partial [Acidobacteriota bacterium]